jgi:DNA-damage-inducible protein D
MHNMTDEQSLAVAGGASPFDQIRHEDEQGEWWSARELAQKLGYTGTNVWPNFLRIIREAKRVYESQFGTSKGVFSAIAKNPLASGGRPSAEYLGTIDRIR